MSSSEQEKTKKEQFQEQMRQIAEEASKKTAEELVLDYKGLLYPSVLCSKETFEALETVEAREDDLLIVTYPKCGTNWAVKILHEMVYSIHGKEPALIQAMIEFGKPEKVEYLKQQPSPRVFCTHLYYDDIPKSFFEKKVKMLVIFRNPKDTAVSYYHFCNNNPVLPKYSSWDLFFQDYINGKALWGSYFDHAVAWNKHIDDENILLLTFEEMKEDYTSKLKKISEFFGLSLTDDQLNTVENATSFKSMKENSSETHGKLGHVFFRKGEIGDWKSLFTEEQSQEVDSKFEQFLAGTQLGEKLKYDLYCKF
ncbi:sulfotransferase 6B1 [Bombina bombina]|uniref:sulfotransferase 6B1 n=1 Tax=Bombina bombina TaxID=8345 RepID=UPI00235A70D4|nr:sulfotransferase 6B1 [Bombina bombina]